MIFPQQCKTSQVSTLLLRLFYVLAGWFSVVRSGGYRVVEWSRVSDIDFGATKAVLACTEVACLSPSSRGVSGARSFSKARCPAGEVLTLGDRYVERTTQRACCCWWRPKSASDRITEVDYAIARDSDARDLLLPMTSHGRFVKIGSAPAGDEQPEAGVVYRMADLVTSVSFPCFVRLVHGKSPSLTSPEFGGLLRLDEAFREETVIACALGSPKFNLLEFPLESDIRFRPAQNNEHLLRTPHLQTALAFCLEHVFAYIVSLEYPGSHF